MMKKLYLILFAIGFNYFGFSQGSEAEDGMVFPILKSETVLFPVKSELPPQNPSKTKFVSKKQATVTFSNITRDLNPGLLINELPKQGSKKIVEYNYPQQKETQASKTQSIMPALVKGMSFLANTFNVNTPNDNDMAISDSGVVVSVINSSFFIRDTRYNVPSVTKSLAVFTGTINNGLTCFDPKVMYDPKTDKFVFVCLAGFLDSTSRVILGFSQTNNPNGNWNLYYLPGNPLNNNLWTDYPMIAMTETELFLTANLLTNNSSWQTGFVESIVWQIKKDSAYAGLPLPAVLHHNIKYNNAPIRNLCPVKGGSRLYSPNMYFLSNRNFASQNDTVFLVNITNSITAPNSTVTVRALVSNQSYYFPPEGRQSLATQSLATNDSRNLGAFYENNKIQYVHNTKNPVNNQVSVYYGVINNVTSSSPSVTGYIIPNDTMDFAYPNISYSGITSTDNSAIISFDHTSNKVNPGCSAIQSDANGNFSPVIRIQNGNTYVNLLTSDLERWGDYSGSQRKYNSTNGDVWMSGYFAYNAGNYPRAHAAWVAQLKTNRADSITNPNLVGLNSVNNPNANNVNLFPNPTNSIFSVEFELTQPEYLVFELYDVSGKKIETLLKDWVKVNQNTFSFDTKDLGRGVYFLKISGQTTHITKKVIKD